MPEFDTGKNTSNATFHLNTPTTFSIFTNHLSDSRGSPLSTPDYWVVLLKNGYQTGIDSDNDPNAEGTYRAAAALPSEGVLLLEESIRDWIAATNLPPAFGGNGVDPDTTGATGRQPRRQEIINHEIGHLFGLLHSDGLPTASEPFGDVMAPSCCPPNFVRRASTFGSTSLHKIRSKHKPGSGP